MWTPASFHRRVGKALLCTLCPHACALEDGEVGQCQVRRRCGDRLETSTFATSVRHLDPVERKPLYHYRPGSQALTLAAPGCSFSCHYCQNYRLSQFGRAPDVPWGARPVDAEEVVAEAAGHGAAVGLSYSEPSLAPELTLALAAAGRTRGVEVVWKSNGFLTPEALDRLVPALAAVNIDLKADTDDRHRALTGAPLTPVLEALAGFVRAGVWVEVSTPLIPGLTADLERLRRLAEIICRIGPHIPWHLIRFNPEFRLSRLPPTAVALFPDAVRLARAVGLRHVYVERALGEDGRATFCPSCRHLLVERALYGARVVGLVNGACGRCGTPIPGRWDRPPAANDKEKDHEPRAVPRTHALRLCPSPP